MSRTFLVGLIIFITLNSEAQIQFTKSYPDTLNKKRLQTVLTVQAASYISGLSFLSLIWYKDHERVPFHFYNDSKGYLQIYKLLQVLKRFQSG
jgi:hypothetical protein